MFLTRTALTALALAAAPLAAHATDIAGDGSTNASLPISAAWTTGEFERDDDTDWYRVQLKTGNDYAIAGANLGGMGDHLALYGTTGKLLKEVGGTGEHDGFEFRAGTTGTFFVEVKGNAGDGGYAVRVTTDCRGDLKTLCTQAVGTTKQWLASWATDIDLIKVPLRAGKRYTFTTDAGGDVISEMLLDPAGKVVVQPPEYAPKMTYRAARTATYFVKIVRDQDSGTPYKLTITSP